MVPSLNATSSKPFALVQPHHTSTTVLHCQEDAFTVVILVRLIPHLSHTNFICLDLIWLKHAPDIRLTSFCVLCQSFILLQIFFLLVLHTVWAATKNSDFRLPWSQIWCSRSCKLSLHSSRFPPFLVFMMSYNNIIFYWTDVRVLSMCLSARKGRISRTSWNISGVQSSTSSRLICQRIRNENNIGVKSLFYLNTARS